MNTGKDSGSRPDKSGTGHFLRGKGTNVAMSVIVVAMMLLTTLAAIDTSASGGSIVTGKSGGTEWTYNPSAQTMTFTATDEPEEGYDSGYMKDYSGGMGTAMATEWVNVFKSETTLIISDGVKYIGANSFSGCFLITSVEIGKDVEGIGKAAFSNCIGLTEIPVFPEGFQYFDECVFSECINLTGTVDIPGTNIPNKMFEGCSSITSANLGKMEIIGSGAFKGCTKLGGDIDLTSVITIDEYAFMDCPSIDKVNIGKGLINLEMGAFAGCSGVLYFEGNDNYELKDCMFINKKDPASNIVMACSTSTATDMKIDGENLKAINAFAFYKCTNLLSITIGAGIENAGTSCFAGCTTNKVIVDTGNKYLSVKDSSLVQTIDNVTKVLYSWSTGDIKINDGCNLIDGYAFAGRTDITSVDLNNVSTIGSYAFDGCSNLKTVIMNDSLEIIERYAFKDCSSLDGIFQIPESLVDIGYYAFYNCGGEGFEVDPMNKIFSTDGSGKLLLKTNEQSNDKEIVACRTGTTGDIIIPDDVTTIQSGMFYGCEKITSLTIPSSVIAMGRSICYGCTSLKMIDIQCTDYFYPSGDPFMEFTFFESNGKTPIEKTPENLCGKKFVGEGFVFTVEDGGSETASDSSMAMMISLVLTIFLSLGCFGIILIGRKD